MGSGKGLPFYGTVSARRVERGRGKVVAGSIVSGTEVTDATRVCH